MRAAVVPQQIIKNHAIRPHVVFRPMAGSWSMDRLRSDHGVWDGQSESREDCGGWQGPGAGGD
jgi:hypothetical protein